MPVSVPVDASVVDARMTVPRAEVDAVDAVTLIFFEFSVVPSHARETPFDAVVEMSAAMTLLEMVIPMPAVSTA